MSLVGPNSVALLQEKLFNDFTAVDHDVTACTTLNNADRTNWVTFVHSFEAWYNIEPYTWSAYWTAADLYDRGLQIQTQLLSWQQLLQTNGCTLNEPLIAQPPTGIDWSALKVIVVSVAVIGVAFTVYPIIREVTATARDFRTARPALPAAGGSSPPAESFAARARRTAGAHARAGARRAGAKAKQLASRAHASVRRRLARA